MEKIYKSINLGVEWSRRIGQYFRAYQKHYLSGIVLLILSFLTYSNSLHNGFMVDDYGLFLEDTQTHNIKFILFQILPNGDTGSHLDKSLPVYYRPVPHILIMLNYLCFGTNPVGYHLVNIIFFYLTCLSLYGFLILFLKDQRVSFLTSMLFCVHPLNGMLVNYITATGYNVMVASMILSLVFFLFNEQTGQKKYLVISLFWLLIALGCHEVAIVFPIYVFICLLFKRTIDLRRVVALCTPYILTVGLYIMFRFYYASLKTNVIDKITIFYMSFPEYIATFMKLILWYISKFFFWDGIVLIWATSVVKDNLLLWNLGFWGMLLICILIGVVYKRDNKSLAVAWLGVGFIPVSFACLFQPTIGFMIEPHWLFFASIGMFLLMAEALLFVSRRFNKRLGICLSVIILSMLVMSSRIYNYRWGNEKRYCHYWLQNVPGFKSVIFYLAGAYMRDGDYSVARNLYPQAFSGQRDDWEIYTNLGLIDIEENKWDSATENFGKALNLKPNSAIIYNNLGTVFYRMNDIDKASQSFVRALQLNPYLIEPRLNLADIYRKKEDYKKVTTLMEENLKIDPKDIRSRFYLTEIDLINDNNARAIDLAKGLLLDAQTSDRLVNLGNIFARERFSKMAFALYSRALQIDPNCKQAYFEMGKFYGNHQDFNRAIVFWQEGLHRHPEEKIFEMLIIQAKELSKKNSEQP